MGTEDKVVQPVGKSSPDRDVLNEMLNALIPESDPSPIVDERKPEPEPEETNDDLPPVVLDVAGWRGDGSDRSATRTRPAPQAGDRRPSPAPARAFVRRA